MSDFDEFYIYDGWEDFCKNGDRIEYYEEETIKAWWIRFQSVPSDVLIISDIPFSYYEISRELVKRQNMRDGLEGA